MTSGTVTSGAASATYTLPAGIGAGVYSIHAVYNASAPFAATNDNSQSLTISKATATAITLGSLAQTYTGTPLSATASTTPSGLTVTYTYGGSATPPTLAGSYTVVATISDSNYSGTATGTLVISKATATAITLGSLAQTYTGPALSATALVDYPQTL